MKNKYRDTSRRRTPWDDDLDALTPSQKFIRDRYLRSYEQKHPQIGKSDEARFLNTFLISACKYCGSTNIKRNGYTRNGMQRYKCLDCGRTFNVLTGTLFDDHKISISEWIEFILDIFNYGSINFTSKVNKNAYTTAVYWLKKLFVIVDNIQEDIILHGNVYIDEMYYPVRQSDRVISDGKQRRGLSRDQYCIAVGYDKKHVYAKIMGLGKPSSKRAWDAYGGHIEPESTLIHDKEKSHHVIVKNLKLKEKVYDGNEIKKLDDKHNPLEPINRQHDLLRKFLKSHSGFDRGDLQQYINLYCFMQNPPRNKLEKVNKLINSALYLSKTLKYREVFREKPPK